MLTTSFTPRGSEPSSSHKQLPPEGADRQLFIDLFSAELVCRRVVFCRNVPMQPHGTGEECGFLFLSQRLYSGEARTRGEALWNLGQSVHLMQIGGMEIQGVSDFAYFPTDMYSYERITPSSRPTAYAALLTVLGVSRADLESTTIPPPDFPKLRVLQGLTPPDRPNN